MLDDLDELLILFPMDAVVLYQHEHVPPPVLLIFPQLFIFSLQAFYVRDILFLNLECVALVLVGDFFGSVGEHLPVRVDCANKVLEHYLEDNTFLLAFLACKFYQFGERGNDDLLLLLGEDTRQ